ncbi:hypothetical protein GCM10027514_31220 [Azotobacter armeniacus]
MKGIPQIRGKAAAPPHWGKIAGRSGLRLDIVSGGNEAPCSYIHRDDVRPRCAHPPARSKAQCWCHPGVQALQLAQQALPAGLAAGALEYIAVFEQVEQRGDDPTRPSERTGGRQQAPGR